MIDAFITNLGKYVEDELYGEFLALPASTEEVKALLARIGVDGVLYEEIFITAYNTEVDGLCECLSEHENIDELNYLAALLSEMDDMELTKFEATLEYGDYISSVEALINLAQNLECYEQHPDIKSYDDLGRYYIDELEIFKIPEEISCYFDYESYGQDIAINEGGVFTNDGYIVKNGDEFIEYYSGREDIPDEYRIFAYPDPPEKMPIKQQIEMYGRMAMSHCTSDMPAIVHEGR